VESYSLYEVNEYIKRVIALNFEDAFWIECEINQINENRGNYYLELIEKSEKSGNIIAKASAAIWYKSALFIKKKLGKLFDSVLQSGVEVRLKVNVNFNERYGLSFVIEDVDVNFTMGQMELQRQKVIERLTTENLMTLNHSKVLPSVLQRIAVISSETAAGFADFVQQLQSNGYGYDFQLGIYDSAVQGQKMEAQITSSIREINNEAHLYDCVVIIRGGGSKLDLSGFDNYNIAAHIAKCKIPVITGIGHEIDQTVSDLTSYLSLKTPTAVASYLIDNNAQYEARIIEIGRAINAEIMHRFEKDNQWLNSFRDQLNYLIRDRFSSEMINLKSAENLLRNSTHRVIERQSDKLSGIEALLKVVDPEHILKRGFSYTTTTEGSFILNKKQAAKEKELLIHYNDGQIKVKK